MHILTQGEIDHQVLPVYVIDSEGRNHALHLVRGSHQWKPHLAPGTYHWPALILRPEPGWIVEVMAPRSPWKPVKHAISPYWYEWMNAQSIGSRSAL